MLQFAPQLIAGNSVDMADGLCSKQPVLFAARSVRRCGDRLSRSRAVARCRAVLLRCAGVVHGESRLVFHLVHRGGGVRGCIRVERPLGGHLSFCLLLGVACERDTGRLGFETNARLKTLREN